MTSDETRSAIVAELKYMAQKFDDLAVYSYGGAHDAYSAASGELEDRAHAWENGQEWAEQRDELVKKAEKAQEALARFDAAHPAATEVR